ncbi:phage tail protein, partial [Escherichia coli]|nr:phage tail protein [Escherichia coli]
ALPVGVPVPWPSATPPTGWLKCNGAAFSAEEYPELAKAYPTNILPDLRGEFIRGWDDGRGVDSSRTLLSWQKGSYLVQEANISPDSVVQFSVNDIALLGWDKTETNSDIIRAKSIPTEHIWNPVPVGDWGIQYLGYARPRNIAFNYIVRAA